ncbi:MAG: hypothetical protein NVS4B6_20880 [Mycobacterium sp.]
MTAGQREDGIDAAGAQPSCDQMSGVDRNWSLNAHGRSIIAALSEAPETQVLIAGGGPFGFLGTPGGLPAVWRGILPE